MSGIEIVNATNPARKQLWLKFIVVERNNRDGEIDLGIEYI